ncbi:hypothetical protein [Pseudanabaena sp. 'Roaring Creek']|uniref:hypothetical protein n=1 Tax=Pseudanabaena sp. 'Roaring Creek' TaxID=1681830 RepID=UPI000AB2AAE9|nr:hypothetical protein [Pseudanabaena sp. 'Roaring Creek']
MKTIIIDSESFSRNYYFVSTDRHHAKECIPSTGFNLRSEAIASAIQLNSELKNTPFVQTEVYVFDRHKNLIKSIS